MAFTGQLGTKDSQLGNILLGSAGGGDLEQIVNQSLELVQSAVANENVEDVPQSLALIDSAAAFVEHTEVVNQSLSLIQSATHNIKEELVQQSIVFIQTADGRGPIFMPVAQTISFEQFADGHPNPVHKHVADILALVQSGNRVIPFSIAQSLVFTDAARRFLGAFDTLNLVQMVGVGKSKDGLANALALAQTVGVNSVLQRLVSQPLNLVQSATYILDQSCIEQNYNPFVGVGGDPNYTPPSSSPPVLGDATLTLTYPFVTPSNTLVLKNPDFSNVERLSFNRINRESRGGTLNVFAEPTWPREIVLVLTFSALRAQQLDLVRTFLSQSLGKEIGLKDWENRQWKGIILNPDTALAQPGRMDGQVSLEFEGELV